MESSSRGFVGRCRKGIISQALTDYIKLNWGSTTCRAKEWEEIKLALRGMCLGLTCGVMRQLQADLQVAETSFATLQAMDLADPIAGRVESDVHRHTADI
ncbi:hypothetical protein NDU88_003606 [Pleurodeles waltl]|uniref:Uncharacterized protein n=1 Tax=Pleurodeles waltl TaxID=8319 RepID=A0AAV7QFC8_PLEWA|nr:hypothetical protein NDU88_003606 [Pleurodeles waltl]